MSPPGEDDTMHVGDVQANNKSDKENSAPRRSDPRNMSQSQPTKTTFTFALKPMSTPPFVHSMACNEGLNLVVDLSQSGPSFAQILESNIRKTVEKYEFESFHGEIQFLETKQKKLLEFSEMDMPMILKENKTLPNSSGDDVIEKHDLRCTDAQEIPLIQISGSDFQKKGTSASSSKDNAQAMATENVPLASFNEVNNNQASKLTSAEEMHGCINDQKALTGSENNSDKGCKGKRQGRGYLKKYNSIDEVFQKNKRLRLRGSSSKEVHNPKDKSSRNDGK